MELRYPDVLSPPAPHMWPVVVISAMTAILNMAGG
jgi:hypothetical protein